jgi:hypothetical protein
MRKELSESSSNDEERTNIEIRKVTIRKSIQISEEYKSSLFSTKSESFSKEDPNMNSNYKKMPETSNKIARSHDNLRVPLSGLSHSKEMIYLNSRNNPSFDKSQEFSGIKASSTGKLLLINNNDDGLDRVEERALNQSRHIKLVHEHMEKVQYNKEQEILNQQKKEIRLANERKEAYMKVIRDFEKETSSESEELSLKERVKENIIRYINNHRLDLFVSGKKRIKKAIKNSRRTGFRK